MGTLKERLFCRTDHCDRSFKSVSEGRRIFIGDVHGHFDGLMRLLDSIAPDQADQVYFVGDLIDRGPKSAQVIEFVQKHNYPCVMGNHEQLLLEAFPEGRPFTPGLGAWLHSGGQNTVNSFSDAENLLKHLDWFQSLPAYLDLGDVWLVHAGLHPQLTIAEQTTQEYCWIREEFHSIPEPYFQDKLIITGHTITFTLPGVRPGMLAQGQGWLDIDTGAYHPKSGWLTGFDFTNQMVHQVNVFQRRSRVLPLAEAVTPVLPEQILARRRQLLQL
jgi:serine/threonine protein phosphatase 1